jgi:hypothetical protein
VYHFFAASKTSLSDLFIQLAHFYAFTQSVWNAVINV